MLFKIKKLKQNLITKKEKILVRTRTLPRVFYHKNLCEKHFDSEKSVGGSVALTILLHGVMFKVLFPLKLLNLHSIKREINSISSEEYIVICFKGPRSSYPKAKRRIFLQSPSITSHPNFGPYLHPKSLHTWTARALALPSQPLSRSTLRQLSRNAP